MGKIMEEGREGSEGSERPLFRDGWYSRLTKSYTGASPNVGSSCDVINVAPYGSKEEGGEEEGEEEEDKG